MGFQDRDRYRPAHIPDEWAFVIKPDLAKAMMLRVIASPLRRLCTIEGRFGKENAGRQAAHYTHPNLI
ncbi:hypothetical protein [Streptomyces shenzhenensis]|uniref:Uncharacterized protein n=1 Tax=Streptomyces shenzhenensis TaxID=943815 RepID=A0A3M0HZH3_9ACTN|nr:hypothetical protein [Streptomyces shenzhenensis]RMB81390.1 hypothetical protein CTZ28_34760 [Streptomyces shenzhenensis]